MKKQMREEKPFLGMSYIMFIFISRLYRQLITDGRKNVLFMSREGEYFKRLFDWYQSSLKQKEYIQTHYFYVSRRATLLPSIHEIEKDSFKEIYKNYKDLSVNDFFKNLGLDENELICEEFEDLICQDKKIIDFENSREFERILSSEVFRKVCLCAAQEKREIFVEYLSSLCPNYKTDGVTVIDIGFSGTTQNNIFRILSEKVVINGYYMILNDNNLENTVSSHKKGIVDDPVFSYNISVIEVLLLASHNGVKSYNKNEGRIVPVFSHNPQELECYKNVIYKIQKDVFAQFKNIAKVIAHNCIPESRYIPEFRKKYKRMMLNPTIEELNIYLKIPNIDNFAAFLEDKAVKEEEKHKEFSISSILFLLKTKGQCLRNQNTNWVAAALYRMNLRLLNKVLYIFSDITIFLFSRYLNTRSKRR